MIILALGANLPSLYGPPPDTLAQALTTLESQRIQVLRQSSLWRTAPVPPSDQPRYWNQVIAVYTEYEPLDLLHQLQKIEKEFGRTRNLRNAARIIDIDLIAYNNTLIDLPDLAVPHPRMHERLFVLGPLEEIAPEWRHPILGKTVAELLKALPPGQEAEVVDG